MRPNRATDVDDINRSVDLILFHVLKLGHDENDKPYNVQHMLHTGEQVVHCLEFVNEALSTTISSHPPLLYYQVFAYLMHRHTMPNQPFTIHSVQRGGPNGSSGRRATR